MYDAIAYVSPGGTVLDLNNEQRQVVYLSGLGLPPVENRYVQGTGQHGVTRQGFRLTERIVQMVVEYRGYSREDVFAERALLAGLMKPYSSAGYFRRILPTVGELRLDVHLEEEIEIEEDVAQDPFMVRYGVVWVAPDPVAYAAAQRMQSYVLQALAGGFSFPITFPVTFVGSVIDETASVAIGGSWQTHPTVLLTGPMTNPIIDNLSTGEQLELNPYTISTGEVVTIDTTPGAQSVQNDSGTNLIGKLTDDSDLGEFHLGVDPEVSGGTNSIRVRTSGADANSKIEFRWNDRFAGL